MRALPKVDPASAAIALTDPDPAMSEEELHVVLRAAEAGAFEEFRRLSSQDVLAFVEVADGLLGRRAWPVGQNALSAWSRLFAALNASRGS